MRKFSFLALCLGLMTSLTSCFDDRDTVYNGDPKVEFVNPNFQLSSVNGFSTSSLFISGPSIGGAMTGNISRGNTDSLKIQLVGPHRNEAFEVFYEVDASASTAVEGVHYNFTETKGKVTIPAKSSFGYIKLNYPRLAAGTTGRKTLTFKITGTNDSKTLPSENYKTFYATIFPAHTYKARTMGAQNSTIGSFFATVNGNTYNNTTAAANADIVDVSYAWSSKMLKKKGTTIDSVAVEIPILVAPSRRATTVGPIWGGANLDNPIGATAKSATYKREAAYSFSNTANAEAVTRALNGVTDLTLNNFTATSSATAIEIKENESYSFISSGKKGLIRIRKINPGVTGNVVFDVIVQP